jgi:hypothetical protein
MVMIDTWRNIITGPYRNWVIFQYGPCVILREPGQNLAQQATHLLRQWGPVIRGTPSADFEIIRLEDSVGCVISCHHPDILNYVEGGHANHSQVTLGLTGRAIRDRDASRLQIVHVEQAAG